MSAPISTATRIAGVAGAPIAHSLSPTIFSAWITACGLDAAYLAFHPPFDRFTAFADGLRGVGVVGLNITAPFKRQALDLADRASDRARRAGAANLLIFADDGPIFADNTDGEGLLAALTGAADGYSPSAGATVILGAGGAARGAAGALIEAGAPEVRIVARDLAKAQRLAEELGGPVRVYDVSASAFALTGAQAIINATPQGQGGSAGPDAPLEAAPPRAVVMDMVYRPLRTAFLERAESLGHPTVDGLAMLIGQAAPSFAALFGASPPAIDVRAVAIEAMNR